MSLTRKLVLSFLMMALIPLVLAVAGGGRLFVRHSEAEIAARLQDNVVLAGRYIDQFMLNCLRDVKSFGADPVLQSNSPQQISHSLTLHTYAYPYFDRLWLVSTQGVVLAASGPSPPIGKSFFEWMEYLRDDFEVALGQPAGMVHLSDLQDQTSSILAQASQGSLTDANLRIQLLTRIENAQGQPTEALIADVLTQEIRQIIDDVDGQTPGDEHAHLLDAQGTVLITADRQTALLKPHLDAGAKDYITKPFDLTELRTRVAVGVRTHHLSLAPNPESGGVSGQVLRTTARSLKAAEDCRTPRRWRVCRGAKYGHLIDIQAGSGNCRAMRSIW